MANRSISDSISAVLGIVAAADGEIVGRTRLQKTAFLLELTGLGSGFSYAYKHYGPFSQELADAADFALLFDNLKEEKKQAAWGGQYSVYRTEITPEILDDDPKSQIIAIAKNANPVELELAATAAFLASEGFDDPWGETQLRKPEKVAGGRLERAKTLYNRFKEINVPNAWPDL